MNCSEALAPEAAAPVLLFSCPGASASHAPLTCAGSRPLCPPLGAGSDLIYNEVGSRCLPRVLGALAGPVTRVLYCHTKHRYDLLDLEFFEQLDACGLDCQEVGLRWPGARRGLVPGAVHVP